MFGHSPDLTLAYQHTNNKVSALRYHVLGPRLQEETTDNGRLNRLLADGTGAVCVVPPGEYEIDPTGATASGRGVIVPSNI